MAGVIGTIRRLSIATSDTVAAMRTTPRFGIEFVPGLECTVCLCVEATKVYVLMPVQVRFSFSGNVQRQLAPMVVCVYVVSYQNPQSDFLSSEEYCRRRSCPTFWRPMYGVVELVGQTTMRSRPASSK